MDLKEYDKLVNKLNYAPPMTDCCGQWMEVLHVEPLQGRSTLDVDRSCIVKCKECGGMFRSKYD